MGRKVVRRRRTKEESPAPAQPQVAEFTPGQAYIRRWARENGFKVGDKGRIPAKVMAAFEKRKEQPQEQVHIEPEVPQPGRRRKNAYVCGFCSSGHHDSCPRVVKNGPKAERPLVYCSCQPCSKAA